MKNNTVEIPKDGLEGLKAHWKKDILSGFIVFLIALPLCLGIAMASGVPPMAGIIAAVVGGMLVSMISGSYVTINGPAAGLIVVILGAVESLGKGNPQAGYQAMLAAVVVAGAFLVIAGLLKAGSLGDFFPSSAVHGMLASIGLIIMSKQVHTLLGVKPQGKDPISLMLEIPQSLTRLNPEIAIIGISSLLIMIVMPMFKNRFIRMIPAPMIVVLTGIGLGQLFDLAHEHSYLFLDSHEYTVGPKFLVTLPENVWDGITFPDFSQVLSYPFWVAVISIALVQGLETMLSASAVDQLDPYRRHSNLNKDMSAMGVGSIVSGLLGGLPMIAEIVRSSANVNNGAKTRWANFAHGTFMLVFVVLAPQLIHRIPLASLAAMLVFTGYRLASPKEFKLVYKVGTAQLIVFMSTIVATLATDLIIGIAIGILVKMLTHLYYGAPATALFKTWITIRHKDANTYHIVVAKSAVFSNYLTFRNFLYRIPKGRHIILDFSGADFVDHTVMEHLHHLSEIYAESGGKFELHGLDHLQPLSGHPLAARVNASKPLFRLNLNKRQQQLAVLGERHDYTFSPQKVLFDSRLRRLPFFSTRYFRYEENMLHKYQDDMHLQISDIKAREGAQITLKFYHFTGLLITDLPFGLPQFNLEKEHPIDKVMNKTGFKDIDFHEHPEFSDKFLLQGRNEKFVRAFFTRELMDMLMHYPDYHIESDGESLLIHKKLRLLKEYEIEELMQFGAEWLNYLQLQKRKIYA